LINNRLQNLIFVPKYDNYQKSALLHCKVTILEYFVWMKIFREVLKIRYFFHIFGSSSNIIRPYMWKSLMVFLAEFSESEVKITLFWRFRNSSGIIDFWYRLLISILRVIRPSDCDLKYHFGPKVLEYVRKKLYILRFPQLVFVMIL
jgi:hypothetical protein